ncbi:DNA topoisomerase IB [Dokdonia ponticola]|uniref:DNA topoisomerase IB n=1 Tax=Dokdonia ponticola TaxID=2041041 RepID=A0ABV9I1R7_9FLAO
MMNLDDYKNLDFINSLLNTPDQVIDKLDLIYVYDDSLSIERIKKEKDFDYLHEGKPLKDKDQLARIQGLVIPPAWQQVKISYPYNGHLQAVGRDVKNRKQYRYHPLWNQVRNQTKFLKMTNFGHQLPKIRARVDTDLEKSGWPKKKVLALVIRLMEETHIRIGSRQYAKRNKTYGLATMRTRHVSVAKDKLKFHFVGKKGKEHSISIRNKKLARLVNRCEEIPGWELFQYYDDSGTKHSIDSGMINEYIHDICGELFTAKDFRTWAGTSIFFESLLELGIASSEKEKKENLLTAFDATAKELGNTRNVCRKYYVHPMVIHRYTNDAIAEDFKKLDLLNDEKEYLSDSEIVLLEMMENYTPRFIKDILE